MGKFTPEQDERIQIKSILWAQLAEGYGAHRNHPNRLQEFFALHDCITAYESAELLEAVQHAGERAAEFQKRLMGDDYQRGVVDAYRRICSEWECPVPAWVETVASEIAQRRAELKAEGNADRLNPAVVSAEQVH